MKKNLLTTCVSLSLFLCFFTSLRAEITADQGIVPQQESLGTGDSRIHVIPSLSSQAVKNGEILTITAVVTAKAGVEKVEAEIEGLDKILLQPAPGKLGGIRADGTIGLWRAEWIGHDLEEKFYPVALRVTDLEGHVFEDQSLCFSDPVAGITTVGSPFSPLTQVGCEEFAQGENNLVSAVIDVTAGFAYFGTDNSPGQVVKVALGEESSSPTRIGVVNLETGENKLTCGVIDPQAGFAYFGTYTSPGHVVKIALGAGDAPPTRVAAISLESGENYLISAVIDPVAGYAYFGTLTTPGRVVKIALGAEDDPPNRVAAVTLNSGENILGSAVIDTDSGYACFGTLTSPGRVVKVALGSGENPPTRISAVTLNDGDNNLACAVIDPVAGYAYFGTDTTSNGRIVKVALEEGEAPPEASGDSWCYF